MNAKHTDEQQNDEHQLCGIVVSIVFDHNKRSANTVVQTDFSRFSCLSLDIDCVAVCVCWSIVDHGCAIFNSQALSSPIPQYPGIGKLFKWSPAPSTSFEKDWNAWIGVGCL